MGKKNDLKDRVIEWLLSNPVDDTQPNKYSRVCKRFNISSKTVSYWWNEIKQNKEIPLSPVVLPKVNYTEQQIEQIFKQTGDCLSVVLNKVDIEVKSLGDLLTVCNVDADCWDIISWECKKWDLGIKNKDGNLETKPLYSVSAKFKAKTLEENYKLQRDIILEELYEKAPAHDIINSWNTFNDSCKAFSTSNTKYLLELALFDVHFGKLSHHDEVGEDYDLKIATKRYKDAVKSLISRVNINNVDRILLPIGQDLINVDNLNNSTTKGTPQDCDGRFHKIVKTVKNLLIETINELISIAPVDVVCCVGNHDEQTTFLICEMLDAYYTNCTMVNVYNSASLRKYYKYGNTGILFSHGDKEKFNELGMIFAAENPKLWADTTQRYIQIGHYHHNKLQVLQKQEFQGFQVQILPSLSSNDAWHKGKGFHSLKQAKAFLYDPVDGLVSEMSYTVK